ncbi:hypothetical protein FB451DRAFT_1178231 [Mycena latifolia]|nr:hypothetical protein FB451DRAFT_1178231 [Mycena latifolia]
MSEMPESSPSRDRREHKSSQASRITIPTPRGLGARPVFGRELDSSASFRLNRPDLKACVRRGKPTPAGGTSPDACTTEPKPVPSAGIDELYMSANSMCEVVRDDPLGRASSPEGLTCARRVPVTRPDLVALREGSGMSTKCLSTLEACMGSNGLRWRYSMCLRHGDRLSLCKASSREPSGRIPVFNLKFADLCRPLVRNIA